MGTEGSEFYNSFRFLSLRLGERLQAHHLRGVDEEFLRKVTQIQIRELHLNFRRTLCCDHIVIQGLVGFQDDPGLIFLLFPR